MCFGIEPLVNFIGHLQPNLQNEFIDDLVTEQVLASNLFYPDRSFGILSVKIEIIANSL